MKTTILVFSLLGLLSGCASQEQAAEPAQPGFFGKLWMAPVGPAADGKGPLGPLWLAPAEQQQSEPAPSDGTAGK